MTDYKKRYKMFYISIIVVSLVIGFGIGHLTYAPVKADWISDMFGPYDCYISVWDADNHGLSVGIHDMGYPDGTTKCQSLKNKCVKQSPANYMNYELNVNFPCIWVEEYQECECYPYWTGEHSEIATESL